MEEDIIGEDINVFELLEFGYQEMDGFGLD
jgi:hypothetical protein